MQTGYFYAAFKCDRPMMMMMMKDELTLAWR